MSATPRKSVLTAWTCAALAVCPLLAAQETRPAILCPAERGLVDNDGKDAMVTAKIEALKKNQVANELAESAPLTSPPVAQVSSPSSVGESASLVEGPTFPTLLGFALENNVVSTNQNAVTLNVNPFAFVAFTRPQVLDAPLDYGRYSALRRWNGSVTFGGKGEPFDHDGDGQADPALEARDHNDIVTWEARWRVLGSRDRRDARNFQRFAAATQRTRTNAIEIWGELFDRRRRELDKLIREKVCYDATGLKDFLDRDEVEADLIRFVTARAELDKEIQQVLREIDRSPVLTLVLGGVEREDLFGPSKRSASLRGAIGLQGDMGLTANLDWAETEGIGSLAAPTTWKLGTEFSILLFKNTPIGREDGIKVAFSGAYEMFEDVPAAKHDTNAKLNAKLDLPLAQGIKLPISVTWANHKDLLTPENEIRGHIGFTLSLAEMMKKKSGGG